MHAVGQYIQPLINHSVIFVKETDVIVTSDIWRIMLAADLSSYQEVVATIRGYLHLVELQKTEFTPTFELRQIELLLQALEARLEEFYQNLSCMDRRRGILNLGCTVLKSLFGNTKRLASCNSRTQILHTP